MRIRIHKNRRNTKKNQRYNDLGQDTLYAIKDQALKYVTLWFVT